MKRERYFQDELRKMFVSYAVIPVFVFTLVCGVIFMAAFLYGRLSITRRQNHLVAQELTRVLTGYQDGLKELSAIPGLLEADSGEVSGEASRSRIAEIQRQIYEIVYRLQNEIGYEAEFHVLDQNGNEIGYEVGTGDSRNVHKQQDYGTAVDALGRAGASSWGMFTAMDQKPGCPVIQLKNGWKSQAGILAIGTAVENGYLVFTIPARQMQPLLDQLDTQTVVCDAFGWVYFSNASQFLTGNNQVRTALDEAGHWLSDDGQLYLTMKQSVEPEGFLVYSVANIQNIVISLSIAGLMIITALLGMCLWLVMVSGKVTEKKTEDFYKILDVLEQVKGGNLGTAISIHSENEFQIIADACNEMISGLREQMENNRKMAILVATAQNKQLESQFNPHFLYNTLENIRYMCKLEPATAERMVFNLSGLLRYSLNGGEAEVTLREDLEHLENYLSILRYRFGKRLTCITDVEPEVLACRIPKLVFQPMIENSVKYGFGRQENLRVELKAYRYEDRLIMICRDDGVGMSQQNLSSLTRLLEQEENTSRHSGLYNIHRRIQILYGRLYGVEIRSLEGHGTTLIVTIPAHGEENHAADFDCGG